MSPSSSAGRATSWSSALTSDSTDGMFGDLLATSLKARGVVGLVIDAGCRDVPTLRGDGLSRLVARHFGKGHGEGDAGQRERPRRVRGRAGQRPATFVVADDDGVVVVPTGGGRGSRDGSPKPALANEEGKRARLASGELGLDIYGMREGLAKAGLVYLDDPEEGLIMRPEWRSASPPETA